MGKPFHGYTCPYCCNNTFSVFAYKYPFIGGALVCAKCGVHVKPLSYSELKQFEAQPE